MASPPSAFRERFVKLFSAYKAEWLQGDVFQLFTQPSYFPQLQAATPCILEGGRGTGKTTTLRCLSYQGQEALTKSPPSTWSYYGFYRRINTNRVRAFTGDELPEAQWLKLFAHYLNLELCEAVVAFLGWYTRRHADAEKLDEAALGEVVASLGLSPVKTQAELDVALRVARLRFEADLNNIGNPQTTIWLSLQGAPIDALMKAVKGLSQFADKQFFFLLDEYENLDPGQQRVVNTLIKHCGELYSFKVGVKELGVLDRRTLADGEQLSHPADYKLINVAEELREKFNAFAEAVCMARLERAVADSSRLRTIQEWLPELSEEDEALLLGVERVASRIRAKVDDVHRERGEAPSESLTPLELVVLDARATAEQKTLEQKLAEVAADRQRWKLQYNNYKYAYLFTLKRGKTGIRKYYAGWSVLCLLAAGNIRYLLELVDQAVTMHLDRGGTEADAVSPDVQTLAAQASGRKILRDLEGLSKSGAQLTRLVLGLGRVFQVMASNPVGHTPEVNQFDVVPELGGKVSARANDLLRQGVMHLALVRYQGTKPQEAHDLKDYDYAVHPVFAAFFEFGHRKKRKATVVDKQLELLVDEPKVGIDAVLATQNRPLDADLPEQMELFESYYGVSH